MTALTDTVASVVGVALVEAARSRTRPATPAELARRLMPHRYAVTPALTLISDALAEAVHGPGRRLIVTVPPREGKSLLVSIVGVLYALMCDPDSSVILATYGDDLARELSHQARGLMTEHPGVLGYELAQDKSAVGRWRIAGRRGGLHAAGIGSAITGYGADLVIVDDPVKNQAEADSASRPRAIRREFDSTVMTRLHPGASVIVIQTRWATDDLAGSLLTEEAGRWTHVNIPAVAEAGIPDALEREPGTAMTSALGRTRRELDEVRSRLSSRARYALYQGNPTPAEGGVIRSAWLDGWRLPSVPEHLARVVVGVDPSDSGRGDHCGIVAAGLTATGDVAVLRSRSEPMTAEEWSSAAVLMAVETGATEISVEGFSARETYLRVLTAAVDRYRTGHPGTPPVRVTAWPPLGSGRGRGDAVGRSAGLLVALERGGCRLVGEHPAVEDAAATWLHGQHQPDVLAALVIAHDVLTHSVGGWSVAAPVAVRGGFTERLGSRRPMVDALVSASAARKRAEADGTDPDETVEVQRVARVASVAAYLGRRFDGGGYDPTANYGPAVRSR